MAFLLDRKKYWEKYQYIDCSLQIFQKYQNLKTIGNAYKQKYNRKKKFNIF